MSGKVKGKSGSKGAGGSAAIATAGRTGDDVRSDLFVSVRLADAGGADLEIRSKVNAYYGESIRQAVASVLGAFGVQHARVEVDDKGALPYVIAARVETALRRAGLPGRSLPDRTIRPPEDPTARDRLRRSRLYLPGNEPKFAINAGIHHPDGVILDLEDSVHPDEKDAARILVRNALRCVDFMGAERMVRINQLPLGFDDLAEIVPEHPGNVLG